MAQPPMRITLPYEPERDLEAFVFAELRVVPTVEGRHRGLGELPGYVVLATALTPFLKGLLETLGVKAAEALARAIGRLGSPKGAEAEPYEVRLVDPDRRVTVVVDPEAAKDPRAFRGLAELDSGPHPPGTVLRWDARSVSWRSG